MSPAIWERWHRRVLPVALLASLLFHLGFLIGLPAMRWLRFSMSVPIEILPMKKRESAPPAIEPAPPGDKSDAKEKPAKPAHASDASAKNEKPPAIADLKEVGPAASNITIVLRGPPLARSPYKDAVLTLLATLPDYHTLLDGTGLDLFRDVRALLISTPDPRDVAMTFLAARHRDDPRFAALPDKTLLDGDPRQFHALSDELMLLGRPEDLRRIADAEAGIADAKGRRWLDALEHFDRGAKDAAFELTVGDVQSYVRLEDSKLPLPRTLRLAMTAEASPAVRLRLGFDDAAQAAAFAAAWPELKGKLDALAPPFAGVLNGLVLALEDKDVEVTGRLPESQVRFALSLARLVAPAEAR